MSARRLLTWLMLVALLFAPLAMIGFAPALAHDRAAMASHCADTGAPGEAPAPAPIDCMIACAGLPGHASALAEPVRLAAAPAPAAAASGRAGLEPEAATPPPRAS